MYKALEVADRQINHTFERKEERALGHKINITRVSTHAIMVVAAAVGAWGGTCLINGILGAHSLQEVSRGLLTAIIGI